MMADYEITDDRRNELAISWEANEVLRVGMDMGRAMHWVTPPSSGYPVETKPAGARARKRWKRHRAAGRR